MRLANASLASLALVALAVVLGTPADAGALPPAGTDRLPVVVTADTASLLGEEAVTLTGWAAVQRGEPRLEGGVEVVDVEIVDLNLVGASSVGAITASQPSKVGPVGASAQAAGTGGDNDGFEVRPGQAIADAANFAVDVDSGTSGVLDCADAGKDRHVFSDFNLQLPPASTVDGIAVRLDAGSNDGGPNTYMCVELSWDGGASWTDPKETPNLVDGRPILRLGDAADTWGRAWSPGELTSSDFMVRITNVSDDILRDFILDYIAVDVSYTSSSLGEIRSLQTGQDFPASSFFDLFVSIGIPGAPGGRVDLHNQLALHLTPRDGGQPVDLNSWPPLGVTYALDPLAGIDNDGDTLIDEDTRDEDGDGLIDEDGPGPDPVTPGSSLTPLCELMVPGDADCDRVDGEDPPTRHCTLAACDDDDDGQFDEDPACLPLVNASNRPEKAGFCLGNLTLQFAPELPSFSVAPGGPSDIHPAAILGLAPPSSILEPPPADSLTLVDCNDDFSGLGFQSQVSFSASAGETYRFQVGSWANTPAGSLTLNVFSGAGSPGTTPVSGNDNFASAWVIPALPFLGQQSTVGFTTEAGEPTVNPCTTFAGEIIQKTMNKTAWLSFMATADEIVTVTTEGSSHDTVLAVHTGDSFGPRAVDDQPPFVRIACANLGLTADGCDDGADLDQDDLNALSFGGDLSDGGAPSVSFSVGPGAQGWGGSAVRVQHDCPSPEAEPDEFATGFLGTNTQVLDGNGPIGSCVGAFPFGLVEAASQRDDVDALYRLDPDTIDTDADGIPDQPLYFSLGSGSPSLSTFGFSSGDVLRALNAAQPTLFASAASLGLQAGDDVDAVCLQESGDGTFDGADSLFFSLTPGSPTLSEIGAGPGDLLAPGGADPAVVQRYLFLGLLDTDDVNALSCQAAFTKDGGADTDGDTVPNATDEDDDNDGCTDQQELAANPVLGGLRSPHNFWDFFDTPGAQNVRDRAITAADITRLVQRFGATGDASIDPMSPPGPPPGYHTAFDRTPFGAAPDGRPQGPNGSVAAQDIALVVGQFGHTCVT